MKKLLALLALCAPTTAQYTGRVAMSFDGRLAVTLRVI